MPEQETVKRARRGAREGKAPSTQAGEFLSTKRSNMCEKASTAHAPPARQSQLDCQKERREKKVIKPQITDERDLFPSSAWFGAALALIATTKH